VEETVHFLAKEVLPEFHNEMDSGKIADGNDKEL
jgi:hypothetical protein